MKIAAAQISRIPGNVEANCDKIRSNIGKAKDAGCDMVVFPELSDIVYDLSLVLDKASTWDESPLALVRKAASEHQICCVCGLSERIEKEIYNSIAVVDPTGEIISKYRKVHLFSPSPVHEDRFFSKGQTFETFNYQGWRCRLAICYDLRFPETFRSPDPLGANLLVICSAWPNARAAHWSALAIARAIENPSHWTDSCMSGGVQSSIAHTSNS
jgi:predicted amidohydrolase